MSHHSNVDHCHYEGHLVNSEGTSSVALSNCRGLVSEALQILFYFKLSLLLFLCCSIRMLASSLFRIVPQECL